MTLMRLAPRKPKISTGPKCLHGTEKDSTLTLHWVLNREIWFFLSIFSYVFIRPYPPFCGHTLLPKINLLTNLNLHSMTSLYISNYLTVEGKHIKKKSINVHYFLITFPLKKTLPSIWTNLNYRGPGLLWPKYILQDTLPEFKKSYTTSYRR